MSAALEREGLLGGVRRDGCSAPGRHGQDSPAACGPPHDLRSPLTAISAASEAIALTDGPRRRERGEMASVHPGGETRRLARLRGQPARPPHAWKAGAAEPHRCLELRSRS